jgi:4-amino-4-deoxychorismate lyase
MLIDGLPSEQLPATDRGLAYGDGLFETIRIHRGRPLFLEQHLQRLALGCARLGIATNLPQWQHWLELALQQDHVMKSGQEHAQAGVLKLIITRGSGGRGYRLPEPTQPRCLISLHALPQSSLHDSREGIKAFVCEQRLAHQPTLAGIKHLNRLEQVLASREFPDASWHEGLMRDYADNLVEGTRCNLFVARKGRLLTPDLTYCGIAGILRAQLLDLFGSRVEVGTVPSASLLDTDEIFVCNSVLGIWPVRHLRYAGKERLLEVGPWAREALSWFDGVLA